MDALVNEPNKDTRGREYDPSTGKTRPSREEAEAIAGLAPRATFEEVADLDHALTRQPSLTEALARLGTGDDAPALRTRIIAWMRSALRP